MKKWQIDVLVIGSGLAGIRAALEARLAGATVLLVSEAAIGKANNTAISKGFFAIPGRGNHGDDAGQHLIDIITGGCNLNDPELVTVMVNNLKNEADFLLESGVTLTLRSDGGLRYSKFPGHTFPRVLNTTSGSGVGLLAPLAARAAALGVWMEQGITIISLQKDTDGVCGVWGHTRQGEPVFMQSSAVILATGGAGRLYLHTNNVPGAVGLGQAMALNAGLALVDMEFVQFYPTYLRMPGKPRVIILYEVFVANAGATLRNCLGEDIRNIYNLHDTQTLTRDKLSVAIASEISAGRGVGPDGDAVIMDLSTIKDPAKYHKLLPGAVSPHTSELHVGPVAHFTMGGIAVQPGGETQMPGLWAIGEVAGGIHGANRVGANALAECLALGRVAGNAAALYAQRTGRRTPGTDPVPPFKPDIPKADLSAVEEALRKTMIAQAGMLRDAESLQACLNTIDALEEKLAGQKSLGNLKLGMMLDVARAISLSALAREESRGSHYRLDFPDMCDNYLGNFLIQKFDGKKLKTTFLPRRSLTGV